MLVLTLFPRLRTINDMRTLSITLPHYHLMVLSQQENQVLFLA